MSKQQIDEEVLQLMERTANMLRGMTMDPAIPEHTKDAMRERIKMLDAAIESCFDA